MEQKLSLERERLLSGRYFLLLTVTVRTLCSLFCVYHVHERTLIPEENTAVDKYMNRIHVIGLIENVGSILFAVCILTTLKKMMPENQFVFVAPLWIIWPTIGTLLWFFKYVKSLWILLVHILFSVR